MKKSKKKMTKETKMAILKFFIFIFIIFCIFSVFVFFHAAKGRRLKRVTVEVQVEKLNNSIKIFKALEGRYPELAGKEDNLKEIVTSKGVSFQEIYEDEKVFALPKDIKNKIVWLPKSTQGVDWDSLVILLKNICGFSNTSFNNSTITEITKKIGRCFESVNEEKKGFNYSNSVPRSIRRLSENNFKPNRTNKTFQKIEDIFSKIF